MTYQLVFQWVNLSLMCQEFNKRPIVQLFIFGLFDTFFLSHHNCYRSFQIPCYFRPPVNCMSYVTNYHFRGTLAVTSYIFNPMEFGDGPSEVWVWNVQESELTCVSLHKRVLYCVLVVSDHNVANMCQIRIGFNSSCSFWCIY